MAINNITQTISTIPEAAHRGVDVQTQFVIKQEDFQDHLQGTTVTELNTLKDQLNLRIGEINSTATTMNGYADTASAGASTATTKAGEASTSASDALAYKNQAETFKNNASASATKASQWSDNNYNVEVEIGRYSAKHWSTVAQNTVNNKIDKVASTDNAVVRFDGVTGEVQNSGVIIDDNNNVGIGTSNPTDKLTMYSASGNLFSRIQSGTSTLLTGVYSDGTTCVNSLGNYPLILSTNNAERMRIDTAGNVGIGMSNPTAKFQVAGGFSASTLGSFPSLISSGSYGGGIGLFDSVSYTGMYATGNGQVLNFFTNANNSSTVASSTKMTLDAAGNLQLTSGTGGLGYGTGAGGTVTQLTSKSTAVTLNKPTGQIITSNSSLAAGVTTAFILNNSLLTGNDTVKVIVGGAGASGAYESDCTYCVNGAANITIKNLDAVSRTDTVAINFTMIKGAIT